MKIPLFCFRRDDDRLRHDNYDSMRNRKYRTSKIGPFSSNVGFVLFNCGGKKKVLLMHQVTVSFTLS
jgi:hypothetical protein